ncbi:hypothetical protein HDV02_006214 [Globomyces sp. JEL0801]|nr:hypothetical protein HDV02_006214 [Globomyces sp. JEL0801]
MNETTFDHEFFPPSQPSNLDRNSISILETKENNSKGIENTTDPTIEQLQLQLHSYNKIQQLQDKMISKNHSNQYDLVLTRWRQKVLQLMIENKFMEKEYTETINKLILENKELKDKGTIKQITKLDASDEKHYKDDLTSEDIISMEMLKKDLISKDREISILQEDLQSKVDEIYRYQEELKSKNANINELQDHLHSNQTQQDTMSNQILELQSKLQFKESQLKELNSKLNEQNQQIVEQTQTISRLTSGYNPTTSASPSNHTQQQNINPTLQDVVHQQKSKLIECLENHIQSIQHKLIDFHTHQGETNENTNDWSDQNNFLPKLSDNKSESNEVKTIVELENHVELLRKEINRLSRVEELELELRILQSQMCNNSKEKNDTNEITVLKTQIEDMQQKTIKWKKQVSVEFSKQNKMISNQQNEIDELNQEIEELVIALENKAEKYNDLEAKLMDVIDRSDEDMTELRNEILDLQSQLESKNDSLLFDRNVYMKEKVKEISSRM